MKNKTIITVLIIFIILLIDQASKIYVKTNFYIGEEVPIFGWERGIIHFVENEGMAFGWELGGDYGKLALSLFRLVAISFLIFYIRTLIKADYAIGLICSFALILAGAIGNIIDSAFYGMIFSASAPAYHSADGMLAQFMPAEGGYAPFLHGKVVDMFYFPLFEGVIPSWVPKIGDEPFLLFRHIFNIADAAISIGVVSLILFQRSYFSDNKEAENVTAVEESSEIKSIEHLDEKNDAA